MKKIYFIALLIISSLLFGNSCDKDNDPVSCNTQNTVLFPQDALDRFYFDTSTYWVYQDSATSTLDSVWVTYSINEIRNVDEEFQKLHNKCYQNDIYYRLTSINGERMNVNFNVHEKDYEIPYSQEYFGVIFYIKKGSQYVPVHRLDLDGNSYRKENANYGIWDTIPNLMVKGVEYFNVLQLTNPQSNVDIYSRAWYVKNVGLVKYAKKDGSTWELIRYKVKQ